MRKRTRRLARAARRATALVGRHEARRSRTTSAATTGPRPLTLPQAWEQHERVGDLHLSPATSLLDASDEDAEILARWPIVVHRSGYRLPEEPICLAQMAAASGISPTAMARQITSLQAVELLVWMPAHQLFVLNSVFCSTSPDAREFSELLWQLGHVPQPDRPTDRWDAEINVELEELRIHRSGTDDEEEFLLCLDEPTTDAAEEALAPETLLWRASENWTFCEDAGTYTAQFSQPRIDELESGDKYSPGTVVILQPWDDDWLSLVMAKGWTCAEPSDTRPPHGLW